MRDATDIELVEQFKEGNTLVFEVLVDRYKKRIYFFALKLTQDHQEAEDISQETFMRAYRGLKKFRGQGHFASWLLTIATNYYRSYRRKPKLQVVADYNIDHICEQQDCNDENAQKLKIAIQKLPEKQKLALVLRTFEELSYQQISQAMGISLDSVKANISYARRQLRCELMELDK